MGVEQIYKLPEEQQSGAGVMMQTIGVLFGITIMACWIATQWAAYKLAYQPALGELLLAFKSFKLYMPFDFFIWLLQFGHVDGTEAAWDGGEKILFSLHPFLAPFPLHPRDLASRAPRQEVRRQVGPAWIGALGR